MTTTGGCYCGEIRYEADGEPVMKGECHCRECQYITGGQANDFMAMPTAGFRYTKGEPKGKGFRRCRGKGFRRCRWRWQTYSW